MGAVDPLFAHESVMAGAMRDTDWAATPLGPSEHWSQSLRTTVSILLRSRFPMILTWGDDLVMLYNDAFIPTLGAKHPGAVGGLLRNEFAEVWDDVGPMQRSVLAGGEAVWAEDLPLVIERGGGPEQAYFTFSYSHVPDEDGPGGVLAVLSMTTDEVVAARRLTVLNELVLAGNRAADPEAAVNLVMKTLGDAGAELAAGTMYQPTDDGQDREILVRGSSFGQVPEQVLPASLEDPAHFVRQAWSTGRIVIDRAGGGEGEAPELRIALPVSVQDTSGAVLVLCPHPLRPFDEGHERFVGLVAEQVGQILTVATERAREHSRLQALAELDAAKTAFLSNVSHEFRTPLTLLLGPLEDVLSGRTEELHPSDLEEMYHSAHRLLRMVNGLLDVARIEADGLHAVEEPTDLAELTRDLLQPFGPAAARADVALETELDPLLGTVQVDPELWEKIVLNLVANAVKYTSDGTITVTLGLDGDRVVLRVADTGVGIAEEEIGVVFERFHRVQDSGGRSIEGTGIGLSIVAEATRALGGTVSVTSEPGVGSVFEVALPHVVGGSAGGSTWSPHLDVAAELARDAGGGAGSETVTVTPAAAATGARPSILVCEDNAAMRARLTRVIAELGETVAVPDGRAALDVLRDRHFDLVVTDVMMPELDGVGLLREIRADALLRSIPVVLLSARAGPEAAAEAIEAGADDYVVKPFTTGELLARCRTSLELAEYRATEAAGRVRGALLAGVSHDMQTPLAVISSTLELISGGDMTVDAASNLAERARPRTLQLTQLVTQFLDWSRLTMNQPLPLRTASHDLRDLAEHVASEYDDVRVTGDPHPIPASCDRARTEQILHNLVDNAVRVARSTVEIRLEAGQDVHVARVVDDGPGVGPDVLPRLFEAFGPTGGAPGNGLGLHVSREAARAQGGDLVLEATSAEGSVFTLTVPRDPP